MLKRKWWLIATILLISTFAFFFVYTKDPADNSISSRVQQKKFRDVVTSPGELMAENTEYVSAPSDLQTNRIYEEIKIQDMVSEGSMVKKGDYVAMLDPSVVNKNISDLQMELDKANSTVAQTALDTALTLRESRDQMTNLKFQMEQKKLALQLSKYEPPATIRQAEIDLEKAEKDLIQMKENYEIKKKQAGTKMLQAGREVQRIQERIDRLVDLRERFRIIAPKNGLLVYIPDWMTGGKKKTGSVVRPWDPRVAMLPDLSSMLSKTYINEVDISKLKKSQTVSMGLDAFPEVKLTGIVKSVANIGENRPGSNAKVFEVLIKLDKVDSLLKPGMTTSNNILINEVPAQLVVPLEAVFTEKNISFVYLKKGPAIEKKQVKLGKSNDEEVIVLKGLSSEDEVYLTEPASAKDKKIAALQ